MDEYADKINDGGFGIKSRVLAKAAKDIPSLIDKDAKPEDLELTKILLKVFKERSYDALGDFSKDSMLVSCMHFLVSTRSTSSPASIIWAAILPIAVASPGPA